METLRRAASALSLAGPSAGGPSQDLPEETDENTRLRRIIERRELEQQIALTDSTHREELLALLAIKTAGKLIDKNYQAYCHKLMIDYLDKIPVLSPVVKAKAMKNIYQRHIYEKTKELPWTVAEVEKANEYNENQAGIVYKRNPFLFFIWHKVELKQDLNSISPLRDQPSTRWYHWILPVVIGIPTLCLVGRYIIFPLYRTAWHCITTPPVLNQVTPHISIDIKPPYCPSISPVTSPGSISISENLSATQDLGADNSMWTALKTSLGGIFTKLLPTASMQAIEPPTMSALLLRSRSSLLTNINLPALSKPAISHLTSNMADLSNHWNASSVCTTAIDTISPKVTMTRLLDALTTYVGSIDTIPRQTTQLLTHTLPSKCFASHTPFTLPFTNIIANCDHLAARLLSIDAEIDKATTIRFVEPACRVMSTHPLATVSSITVLSCVCWKTLVSRVKLLLTVTTVLFSAMLLSLSLLSNNFDVTTWKPC
uniref:Uncharacterized protein n=1 Tax=Raphidiopteran tombus-related virus TaxID=2822559 RepID=A0A8A6RJU4_9TOMB|nr:hypothetical protein [Raphidiopteran tombus-related virus]